MDATDRAVRQELERRLAILEQERGAVHSMPLPRADLVVFVLIVVVAALAGMIAGAL